VFILQYLFFPKIRKYWTNICFE